MLTINPSLLINTTFSPSCNIPVMFEDIERSITFGVVSVSKRTYLPHILPNESMKMGMEVLFYS